MIEISFNVYTLKFIGNQETGERFFKKMEEFEISPSKIGGYEPVREPYTFDRAIELWTKSNPGCWEEGRGLIGFAGGMMGKSKAPHYWFDCMWFKHPERKSLSYITFHCSLKMFGQYQKEIEELFRDTLLSFDAIYGYISHENAQSRQHVAGKLDTRMPGVFWCNYFGSIYVDFFGKEKILSFPWYKTEEFGNGGLITYLAKEPDKEILESTSLETRAKEHLGIESFGDVELEIKNSKNIPMPTQIRKVPKLY